MKVLASCELCGEEVESTFSVKVEGARLETCEDCSSMGERAGTRAVSSSGGNRNRDQGRETRALARDYGERIKESREESGLTQKELAEKIGEKVSTLSKIEREELKPDSSTGEVLEKILDIELYVNPELGVGDGGDGGSGDGRTLGDVADLD